METITEICPHFGGCGGCRFQDLPYPEQLRNKEERCRALRDEAGLSREINPIVPSPRISGYRNKMEFSFGEEEGETVCGLHRRGERRSVFQVRRCLIAPEGTEAVVAALSGFARRSGLPAYDPWRRRGYWRNLVIREGRAAGRLLVNLVTTSQGKLDREGLETAIDRLGLPGRELSLIHTVNDSLSNAVVPGEFTVIRGDPYLEERIAGLTFRIPPFSFFQVNPGIMEIFYRRLKESLRLRGVEKVLDIFSGSGAIGLVLSREAESILGIELDPEAVAAARVNTRLNGVENLSFLEGPAARILAEHRFEWPGRFDLAVVNPPRSGISKKIAKRLRELGPVRIVYSSCNPETFFPQTGLLAERYRPVLLQPFDFFPHTPHLEILAVFERIDSGQGIT